MVAARVEVPAVPIGPFGVTATVTGVPVVPALGKLTVSAVARAGPATRDCGLPVIVAPAATRARL